jgi:hypothetical protein
LSNGTTKPDDADISNTAPCGSFHQEPLPAFEADNARGSLGRCETGEAGRQPLVCGYNIMIPVPIQRSPVRVFPAPDTSTVAEYARNAYGVNTPWRLHGFHVYTSKHEG